jgi:hypothetical protein
MPWRLFGVKPFSVSDGFLFIFASGFVSSLLSYLAEHPNIVGGIIGLGTGAVFWLRERAKNEHANRISDNDHWRELSNTQQRLIATVMEKDSRISELEREKIRLEKTCEQYAAIISERQRPDPSTKTTAFLPPPFPTRD